MANTDQLVEWRETQNTLCDCKVYEGAPLCPHFLYWQPPMTHYETVLGGGFREVIEHGNKLCDCPIYRGAPVCPHFSDEELDFVRAFNSRSG